MYKASENLKYILFLGIKSSENLVSPRANLKKTFIRRKIYAPLLGMLKVESTIAGRNIFLEIGSSTRQLRVDRENVRVNLKFPNFCVSISFS